MSTKKPSHAETTEAWDVVARAKYRAELEDHVAFLVSGRDNLLEPEANILRPFLRGSHVVQLQCSHGLDALGLLNAGAGSVLGVDISGEMIAQAKDELSRDPVITWNVLSAGVAMFGLLLALNSIGDAVRDILDPRTLKEGQ